MKFRFFAILTCFFLLAGIPCAYAAENTAEDLSGSTLFSGAAFEDYTFLTNKDNTDVQTSAGNAQITLENKKGMASLYIALDRLYGTYTVVDNATGTSVTAGEQGYLHEFIDLEAAFGYAPSSVTLQFLNGEVSLCEIEVFGSGTVPDHVQRWHDPLDGRADIALFSTHGDDEQLYFAGLLPLYAGELGMEVQVIYMTDHANVGGLRQHEMLDGLWAVGVRYYPVFGPFEDFRIDDKAETYLEYEKLGVTREDILEYVVENLRRFRPLVAVGHDLNGEYGHGMHQVYAEILMEAAVISSDPDLFPESAEKYGLWDIPKTYLHLYEKNPIVVDYDQPLQDFGGLTAFQVSQQLGFPCHKSQQNILYTDWLYGAEDQEPITNAADIKEYNPCLFGLLRSTVGEDREKNDFMENLTSREEEAAIRAEEEFQEYLRQQQSFPTTDDTPAPEQTQPSEPAQPEENELAHWSTPLLSGGGMLIVLLAAVIPVLLKIRAGKK